jgi:hemoglobin
MTEQTAYEAIGGEEGVRRLVVRFYELMDSLPEAKACRDIHPEDLSGSAEKLYEYLTGWMGGPQLFIQKHGAPMLRARHLHAPIGEAETEGWITCFLRAWAETVTDRSLDEWILPQIIGLARKMQNRGMQAPASAASAGPPGSGQG